MTPDQRLAALVQERTERKDELDLPRSMTPREVSTYLERTAFLDHRIKALRNAMAELAALLPVACEQVWHDHLITCRNTLCDELLALPARIRDKAEMGRQQNLTLSIRVIDFGTGVIEGSGYGLTTLRLGQLMRELGYEPVGADANRNYLGEMPWYGSIKEVERRIADLQKRRTEAEAALADAMLDDAERAQRDAENRARCAALNAMPQRKTRGDGSQYDKYPDGRMVEVTS